jgi:hypothetical protein
VVTIVPFLLVAIVVTAGIALIFGTILFVVIRGARGPSRGLQSRFSTRPVNDGFWIHYDGVPDCSNIHYYYWADGARHTGSVPCLPGADGRQFVYTGVAPDQITVSGAGDDGVPISTLPPMFPPAQTNSPSSSFLGFPSAY